MCSLVDQCFQMIYTEATLRFFDHNVMEGAQTFGALRSASVDYSYNTGVCVCVLLALLRLLGL